MITEEYLKQNFITAHYIDNESKNREILSTSENNTQTIPTIIEYNEEHPYFKALMTMVTLDQLHEYTYQKVKSERKLFEESVLRIARKDGIIMDSAKIDTKFYPKVVDALFNDEDNQDHIFALKLAVFELDGIKDSDKEDLKKKLRQSKSKIEVLSIACDILS